MNKLIGIIAVTCAFTVSVHAQESAGDNVHNANAAPAQSQPATVGDGVRQVGQDAKVAGHKVRKAVLTLCADGRHTIKGHAGCNGHGGVSVNN